MLKYDILEFRDWLMQQRDVHWFPCYVTITLDSLHNLMNAFHMEVTHQEAQMERDCIKRLSAERAARDAEREAAAHRNAVDAVHFEQSAAEAGPENLRHGIESDVR
jgi:hypothetical protein